MTRLAVVAMTAALAGCVPPPIAEGGRREVTAQLDPTNPCRVMLWPTWSTDKPMTAIIEGCKP